LFERGGILCRVEDSLGQRFAHAVATKDHSAVLDLLHPEVDFRAMTPKRVWEAEQPQDVVDALGHWFGDGDTIEQLVAVDSDHFADRERVGYRLQVRNTDGAHLVEQQAYIGERDGKIGWIRILCAGYRPLADAGDRSHVR
jgi:hypothetical protein